MPSKKTSWPTVPKLLQAKEAKLVVSLKTAVHPFVKAHSRVKLSSSKRIKSFPSLVSSVELIWTIAPQLPQSHEICCFMNYVTLFFSLVWDASRYPTETLLQIDSKLHSQNIQLWKRYLCSKRAIFTLYFVLKKLAERNLRCESPPDKDFPMKSWSQPPGKKINTAHNILSLSQHFSMIQGLILELNCRNIQLETRD